RIQATSRRVSNCCCQGWMLPGSMNATTSSGSGRPPPSERSAQDHVCAGGYPGRRGSGGTGGRAFGHRARGGRGCIHGYRPRRTSRVKRRTTLLLVRLRFHIVAQHGAEEQQLLAEDCQVLAFAGPAQNAEWLSDNQAIEGLLQAPSEGNIYPEQAEEFLRKVLD